MPEFSDFDAGRWTDARGRTVNALRAVVFNLVFYAWTTIMVLSALPTALHRPALRRMSSIWASSSVQIAAFVAGVKWQVAGREHVPHEPFIVAAKHQSAWDIIGLLALFPDAAFVVKRELAWIPLFGWLMTRLEHVPVDRAGGAAAMRGMLEAARARAEAGRPLIVFPQGTRTAPRAQAPYLPGVAALYRELKLPVVPVALDSGVFWPRRRLSLRPGCIQLQILPTIAPGLDRREFMATLERRIEAETDRLVDVAIVGD